MAINTEKSEAFVFSRQLITLCQFVSPNGKAILWKRSVKYLGVILGPWLWFRDHVFQCLQRVHSVKAKLFLFFHRMFNAQSALVNLLDNTDRWDSYLESLEVRPEFGRLRADILATKGYTILYNLRTGLCPCLLYTSRCV